jgi:hypothetical protein
VLEQKADMSVNSALINDIKSVASGRQSCLIQKVSRDQNQAAHNLAQHAIKTSSSSKDYFSYVPTCIQDIVYNDRLRCRSSGDLT